MIFEAFLQGTKLLHGIVLVDSSHLISLLGNISVKIVTQQLEWLELLFVGSVRHIRFDFTPTIQVRSTLVASL